MPASRCTAKAGLRPKSRRRTGAEAAIAMTTDMTAQQHKHLGMRVTAIMGIEVAAFGRVLFDADQQLLESSAPQQRRVSSYIATLTDVSRR